MASVPDRIVDISAPLHEGIVTFPGDQCFSRTSGASLDAGDPMTVSALHLGAHTGTHVDAPNHFLRGAGGIETLPLDALIGPAVVFAVPDDAPVITAAVLEAAAIPAGATRLLAKTRSSGWTTRGAGFDEGFVAFDHGAARWCVERGVVLLGIDYLSIEPYDADERGYPVHKELLGAGVVVLESLELDGVVPGEHELVVLPLRIPGADGAPARALLRG